MIKDVQCEGWPTLWIHISVIERIWAKL